MGIATVKTPIQCIIVDVESVCVVSVGDVEPEATTQVPDLNTV